MSATPLGIPPDLFLCLTDRHVPLIVRSMDHNVEIMYRDI